MADLQDVRCKVVALAQVFLHIEAGVRGEKRAEIRRQDLLGQTGIVQFAAADELRPGREDVYAVRAMPDAVPCSQGDERCAPRLDLRHEFRPLPRPGMVPAIYDEGADLIFFQNVIEAVEMVQLRMGDD